MRLVSDGAMLAPTGVQSAHLPYTCMVWVSDTGAVEPRSRFGATSVGAMYIRDAWLVGGGLLLWLLALLAVGVVVLGA
jgi:hypothetical protein